MFDVDRWHEWTPSIHRVKRLEGAPLVPGTRVLIRQPGLPPALWKVASVEAGQSFTWVSTAPGLRVIARHAVAPFEGGTRATLAIEMQGMFGGFWGRLTGGITRRYIDLEAKGLRARSLDPTYRHGGP